MTNFYGWVGDRDKMRAPGALYFLLWSRRCLKLIVLSTSQCLCSSSCSQIRRGPIPASVSFPGRLGEQSPAEVACSPTEHACVGNRICLILVLVSALGFLVLVGVFLQ